MKRKISVSIEEGAIRLLEEELERGVFRSRSHLIEFALNDFIKRHSRDARER